MGRRLQYFVSLSIVFHALHRFNNQEYIIQSFRGDTITQSRRSLSERLLLSSNDNNTTVHQYDKVIGGEYCKYCPYAKPFENGQLCIDRVNYMKGKYKITEEEAREDQYISAFCNAPYFYDETNVYTEEDEPSVLIHAGKSAFVLFCLVLLCV